MNKNDLKGLTVKTIVCLMFIHGLAWAELSDFTDWHLKSSQNNIDVYNRRVGNMPTMMFKTIATIDEPVDKVVTVLGDLERRNRWEPFFWKR